jgi:putative hydrolase of the HAD superfamily
LARGWGSQRRAPTSQCIRTHFRARAAQVLPWEHPRLRDDAPPDAVLFDAMGTLLRLQPPAPRLRAELARRFDLHVTEEQARAAIGAEIAYYRAHHDEGRDAESLAALRARCAEALGAALPGPAPPLEELTEALLAALRFSPYDDAAPALRRLGERGVRRVVVSNWDVSLHEALERTGLAPLLDGAVTSAEAGAAKPDPALFRRGLALAGVPAERAVHVGDTLAFDVEGARAAGVRPVLIVRAGDPPAGVETVRRLTELPGAGP